MSDGKKRIKIIFHSDGRITAATEGMYGKECLPYMGLVFTALDAVPELPANRAAELLSDDYYVHNPEQTEEEGEIGTQQKNYVQVG